MEISLSTANTIYKWANLLIIVGSVSALTGTITALWSRGIRERFANERVAANEAEIAKAKAEAAKANADAAHARIEARERASALEAQIATTNMQAREAEARIASAEQRAAEAVARASHEELERVKLQSQVGWRNLGESDRMALAEAVLPLEKHVASISFNAGDAEAISFSLQIADALVQAGWDAGASPYLNLGVPRFGVSISATNEGQEAAHALSAKLNAIGFDASVLPDIDSRSGRSIWVDVGLKPFGARGAQKPLGRN